MQTLWTVFEQKDSLNHILLLSKNSTWENVQGQARFDYFENIYIDITSNNPI